MKTNVLLILALAVSLIVLLACTAPYPTMPDNPDKPQNNIVGHAINYEQLGFARPDNTLLQPSSVDFTGVTEQALSVTASEDAIYSQGYLSVRGGGWQPITLSGSQTYGQWVLDEAEANLTLARDDFNLQVGDYAEDNYILTFSCTYLPDDQSWDCHDNRWQLSQFNTTRPQTCTDGCLYEGECYTIGDYLADIDSTCETYGWREMPSEPEEPNPIDDTTDPCEGVDCDDGNPCTTDTCDQGTCTHTPIDGCGAEGECVHFDGLCPAGCTPMSDADCVETALPTPIDIPAEMYDVKEYTDYANVVYVDPSHPSPGDGSSPDSPLATWSDVTFEADTAYVQKRGTTETDRSRFDIDPDNVLMGAYGDGERPVVDGPVTVIGDHVTVRDLDINGGGLEINHPSPHPLYSVLFNNVVHDGAGIGSAGYHSRILNNEVYNIPTDGIFIQYAHDVEIAGNHIHHVNQLFHETTDQNVASGDSIQIVDTSNWWVHHNILDRTDTGNKFCFIATTDFPDMDQYGTFEYNQLAGPLTNGEGGGSIFLGGEPEMVHFRYNLIEGPSPGAVHQNSAMHFYGNVVDGTSNGVSSHWAHPGYVYNNVFANIPGSVLSGGYILSYNNVFDDRDGITGIQEDGGNVYVSDYAAGEVFVDASGGDYRLAAGSPAVDAGVWIGNFSDSFTYDAYGNAVPHDGSIDAGAFQR